MILHVTRYLLFSVLFFSFSFFSDAAFAQRPAPGGTSRGPASASPLEGGDPTVEMDVYIKGADGGPIEVMAVVTLVAPTGQVVAQGTTLGGNIQFSGIAATEYTIQVAAPGYENAVKEFDGYNAGVSRVVIDMRPESNGEKGSGSSQILLAPKAQKELGKALEALRANKPGDARGHLEAAYRKAPNHPAVNYLYGVYFFQMKDQEKAKSYWSKTLEFDPKHVSALLSLSEALMREQKLPDAESYVKRAVEADPNSWRGHAVLADVLLKENLAEEAVKEADRAIELGHGQATAVQPLLVRALVQGGNKERGVKILQEYVREHSDDDAARKQLDSLQSPMVLVSASVAASGEGDPSSTTETAVALPLPSNWLPADIDDKVPPVEAGPACMLDQVLRKAGERVEEFVKNVDRFTASEILKHESINKWGWPESPEMRKFDYVASIDQYRPGYFSVMEYRSGNHALADFPDGVETTGLAALALIFHPNNAGNFAMSCEGLGRWNGRSAWQIHFRQRVDKPNTIRAYKSGENGPAHPVALRGRAWIAADSYQIVRIESDLVAVVPQIRLVTDHTIVDYGPVRFRKGQVEMWLPQNAELYCDWKGKRMHRRLSFSNYLLFSVDEKQKISQPKTEPEGQQEN
jgi:tetratricopeptide (TPR) repeat protein